MPVEPELKTVWTGRFISMAMRGNWEFTVRNSHLPAVGILPVTDNGNVVLIEQFRPAVNESIIELPAGIAGDLPGAEDEPLLNAAQRELLEETGYVAGRWTELVSGYSSPGLSDEAVALFLAQDLEKRGPGGGDEHESITVHEVPMNELMPWLQSHGAHVDLKLLAALFAAQQYL